MSKEWKNLNLLTDIIKEQARNNIIQPIVLRQYQTAAESITSVISELYANIPASKRISYGIVHTVKILGEYLYQELNTSGIPVLETGSAILTTAKDFKSRSGSYHNILRGSEGLSKCAAIL